MDIVRANIVQAEIVRLAPEPHGGWYVIAPNGHGWLHGSRAAALEDKAWLAAQWGRR
jgi:hypothetical protein